MTEDEILVDEIKQQLEPIQGFITYQKHGNLNLSLKSGIPFKQLKNYFPHITKKSLISLFKYCEEHAEATAEAIRQIQTED